ncbi:hypothetical protein CYG48_19025 (plasmid) [Neorhizobium sp. SOG26]|uniref:MmgE/PrpD family protein n=1 Tax=Neorhizobium sp. SOG26 TaxID=2060726 RepID=UPI000E595ECD|nr:MmgE/PrpD family protein [Neorhizobium sp. SOG26]AXV17885.1 hypothetical protein CYG48_19025 [Neorhizobium sp. SOG26]
MANSITEFLGDLVATTASADISASARQRAGVSLVHNLAVAMAGRRREQVAYRIAQSEQATSLATLLHNGARVGVDAAAFANGALFHARSQDDTHPDSTSHPGAPVMAAALALAEERGASGRDFIDAVILGYEILCRVGRDFDQQVTQRGYRAAAVFGIFGAAAAAARLMRLDAVQTGHALGLASHMAGGLAQVWHEGSAEFPLQLGFAARNGIIAARAAEAGATAATFALEGPRGFYHAYAGMTAAMTEPRAELDHWQIEEVTVKPYPACAILQGPLQLLCRILDEEGLSCADVVCLELQLNPYEAAYTGIDNRGPFASATATKMSAQFCLGNALTYGRLALHDLEELGNPDVLAQADKVRVVPTPSIAERFCRIRIRTRAGGEIDRCLDTPVGRPHPEEIRAFAAGLAGEIGAGAAAMERLAATIETLGDARDVHGLIKTVVGIGTKAP